MSTVCRAILHINPSINLFGIFYAYTSYSKHYFVTGTEKNFKIFYFASVKMRRVYKNAKQKFLFLMYANEKLYYMYKNAKLPAPASRASRARQGPPAPIAATVINWKFNLKHYDYEVFCIIHTSYYRRVQQQEVCDEYNEPLQFIAGVVHIPCAKYS